ncbi:MAG: hypothetical protein ACJA2W_003939 [Planctomycetota bacterium]|jgi:hypothetical protein
MNQALASPTARILHLATVVTLLCAAVSFLGCVEVSSSGGWSDRAALSVPASSVREALASLPGVSGNDRSTEFAGQFGAFAFAASVKPAGDGRTQLEVSSNAPAYVSAEIILTVEQILERHGALSGPDAGRLRRVQGWERITPEAKDLGILRRAILNAL